MPNRSLKRRIGGVVLLLLALPSPAFAGELPKIAVIPFANGDGAPDKAGARFAGLVAEELKARDDQVEIVAGPSKAAASAPAASGPQRKGPPPEATAALEAGKKALGDLKFEDAAAQLKKGIEASLADPGYADYPAVWEAMISLAVSYFRMGEEKQAQGVLTHLARLEPNYKLGEGKFPPVFIREWDKAKKRAEKLAKVSVNVDGPMGSTAFVDGRDLGMVPVLEENLAAGPHYIKVEGTRGERFGQMVDVKTGKASVKGEFKAGGSAAAAPPPTPVAVAEPKIGATLDADAMNKVAAYTKAASADFTLVGIVYRTADHQLTASTALYSARRQGFVALPPQTFDHELLTANAEAFKVADDVSVRARSFGAPSSLPLAMVTRSMTVASAEKGTSSRDGDVEVASPTRVAVKSKPQPSEDAPTVRSLERKSDLEREGDGREDVVKDPPPSVVKPSGTPVWVWVVVGVGVAAAAGGGYYGYSQATKPVTGTVTAKWP